MDPCDVNGQCEYVIFSYLHSESTYYSTGNYLKFIAPLYYLGNLFYSVDGTFTAPIDGSYEFFIGAGGRLDTNTNIQYGRFTKIQIIVEKNGQNFLSFYREIIYSYCHVQNSASWIMTLTYGDKIRLKVAQGG